MISVVIPVVDNYHITLECLNNLKRYSTFDNEIIIVDNASDPPYSSYSDISELVTKFIRNDSNVGYYPSLVQGIQAAIHDVVVTMHNDVLIWEQGWDYRLLSEFKNDELLGIVGLFGGRGVGFDGGRAHAESNMLGYKFGQPGFLHGHVLLESHPAVVFDSLFMAFDRRKFTRVNSLFPAMPPHHWCDRIITLAFVRYGYHTRTVGIAFDHGGGLTSSNGRTTMEEFTRHWCEQRNLSIIENPDYTLYKYGEKLFQDLFKDMLPLFVDHKYNYRIG